MSEIKPVKGLRWEAAIALPRHTNLDGLDVPGIYYVEHPKNAPAPLKTWYFTVNAPPTTFRPAGVYQTLVDVKTGDAYYRIHTASMWSPWATFGDAAAKLRDTYAAEPAQGEIQLYTQDMGNLPLPFYVDANGSRVPFAPHPAFVPSAFVIGGANAYTAVGANFIQAGGWGSPTYTTASRAQSTRRTAVSTPAATNSLAGYRCSTKFMICGKYGGFRLSHVLSLSAISEGARAFFGATAGGNRIVPGVGVDNSDIPLVGFGFDAGDTNVQFIHNDNSGFASKIDMGSDFPVALNTLYSMVVWCPPNTAHISYAIRNLETGKINTGVVTSDVPGVDVFMAPQALLNSGHLSNDPAVLDFVQMYAQTGDHFA